MIDVPKLGLDTLNRVLARIAEQEIDPDDFEAADNALEGCRALLDTELRQALTEMAPDHENHIRLEREFMTSLTETHVLKHSRRV